MPRDSSAAGENRERAGALARTRSAASGAGRAVADDSCGGPDHGAHLGAGSGRREAFFFDQESRELLRFVRSREEFREYDAADAAVEAAQQAFADDVDRSGQDGAALQPVAGPALR